MVVSCFDVVFLMLLKDCTVCLSVAVYRERIGNGCNRGVAHLDRV